MNTKASALTAGFRFPYRITYQDFKVENQLNFGPQDIQFAQGALIQAFSTAQSLFYASVQVTNQMKEHDGGNWLCSISPAEVEDGLGYHDFKYIHMSFEREGVRYRIAIAKTSYQ